MSALSGEMLAGSTDAIAIDGVPAGKLGPRERRGLGGCFVPEERNGHGAVRDMSLSENAFLSGNVRQGLSRNGLINSGKTSGFAGDVIKSFDVRTTGPAAEARSLSGGNLQKFIVGREVKQSPKVLVVSQPTWGVDAGAAASIRQALLDLADKGAAVVVISQDLDEADGDGGPHRRHRQRPALGAARRRRSDRGRAGLADGRYRNAAAGRGAHAVSA
jgi:simple sugar transport system ATP-binding protein